MRAAKLTGLWVVLAMGLVVVSACSRGSSTHPNVTINFPYLGGGPEGQALEKVISNFNASQKAITVKGVSSPDFQKQLAQMSGSNGFDISDNFGSTVGSWAAKGILEPLDDYMKADGYSTSDFVPTALQSNQYQGKTYAMPIAVHTLLLMYNKKLFADAGISGPPTKMTELLADILKLAKLDAAA